MKKEELEHIVEDILDDAKSLLSRDGYLVPIAFVCIGKVMHIIKLNFRDKEEKEEQVSKLAKVARMQKADALIMVAESWCVTSNMPYLAIEPSKHPMREECIYIIGECEEGKVAITQKFKREKNVGRDDIIFGERDEVISLGLDLLNFGKDKVKKRGKDVLKSDIKSLKLGIKSFKINMN